jgi:peptidoglycan/xylan/chitin deacetylase (PgdA/CDA1 family)
LAITFDDGYKDNYTTAYPLLNKYKLPATFFFNSAYIETGMEFWSDKLIRLLLNEYELPAKRLEIAQIGKYWDIHRENEDSQLRFNFFMDVWYSLLQAHPNIREEGLREVESWSNHNKEINPESLPMSKAEFMDLANQPLVTIGAHTHNHAALSFLDIESQRQEIKANKIWLEKNTGKKITGFSYPNGSLNSDTVSLLKEMNFGYACTTKEARNSHYISNYKIPRIQVCNWDKSEMINQIKKW